MSKKPVQGPPKSAMKEFQGPPKAARSRDDKIPYAGKTHNRETGSMRKRASLGLSQRSKAGAEAHERRAPREAQKRMLISKTDMAAGERVRKFRTLKAGIKATIESGMQSKRHIRKITKTATGKIGRTTAKKGGIGQKLEMSRAYHKPKKEKS